jgi:hypothetical protein
VTKEKQKGKAQLFVREGRLQNIEKGVTAYSVRGKICPGRAAIPGQLYW